MPHDSDRNNSGGRFWVERIGLFKDGLFSDGVRIVYNKEDSTINDVFIGEFGMHQRWKGKWLKRERERNRHDKYIILDGIFQSGELQNHRRELYY